MTLEEIEKQWQPKINELMGQIKQLTQQLHISDNPTNVGNLKGRIEGLRKQLLSMRLSRDAARNAQRKKNIQEMASMPGAAILEAWEKATANGYVPDKQYPLVVNINGKMIKMLAQKSAGGNVQVTTLNFVKLTPDVSGPVIRHFSIKSTGAIQTLGEMHLWARPDDVQKEIVDDFSKHF